jgi:DNA-binding PadR family transcriptional regulator
MSKRPVSNPLALAVLSCLWERPMYPYEMTTIMRERGKEDSIRLNFGSLYAVIKALEKHALIEATRTEREGNRPERIVYVITDAGKAEALDWLRELVALPIKEYPAFETGLSLLPMLTPEEAITLLRQRLTRLDAALVERERIRKSPEASGVPELFLIEGRYRVAMIEAERAFVASMVARLERGDLGGFELWTSLHEMLAAGHSPAEIEAALAKYMASHTDGEATDIST